MKTVIRTCVVLAVVLFPAVKLFAAPPLPIPHVVPHVIPHFHPYVGGYVHHYHPPIYVRPIVTAPVVAYGVGYVPSVAAIEPPANSSGTATILNAARNTSTARCLINGEEVELSPGQSVKVNLDNPVDIKFDRGMGNGVAVYPLSDGLYKFIRTASGWNLVPSSVLN